LPEKYSPTHASFSDKDFSRYALNSGTLHTAGGTDYFAWNNIPNGATTGGSSSSGGVHPLMTTNMPPFIRGKSKFDNWFVHEVIEGGHRDVIDGTEAVIVVHINHDYQAASPAGATVRASDVRHGSTFWQSGKLGNWQIFHNVHLAINEGTYQNQEGTTHHAPWKLASCTAGGETYQCLQKRLRPGLCPCEHSPFVRKRLFCPPPSTLADTGGLFVLTNTEDGAHTCSALSQSMNLLLYLC